MPETAGKRVETWGDLFQTLGGYMKGEDGTWHAKDPVYGYVAGLADHDVEEHDDGTITVSPSILVKRRKDEPAFHGYLKRGVWSW